MAAAQEDDEISIAAGTYKPTSGTDRSVSFRRIGAVEIYGGFAGHVLTRDERNWGVSPTILSGEIGNPATHADNSYHVVVCGAEATAPLLDGLTIRAGVAAGTGLDRDGGGIVVDHADLTLRNLTVEACRAWSHGAGLGNQGGNVRMESCVVGGTARSGGAVACLDGGQLEFLDSAANGFSDWAGGSFYSQASSLTLANSSILDNFAAYRGGGPYLDGCDAQLSNVVFAGNVCPSEGPSAGGHSLFVSSCAPTLTNVSILLGAPFFPFGADLACDDGTLTFTNSILWGPIAREPALFNDGTMQFSHSIVRGSDGSGASWNPTFGVDLGGNLDVDPQYINPMQPDLRIGPSSPAVNARDDTALPPDLLLDLDGHPRVIGPNVDMGAYEADSSTPARALSLSELKRRFGGR